MPAGCLFDLDGLLLDTEPLHGQAWAEAVSQFGGSASAELLLGLRGRNKFDNASGLIEALQLTVSVEQLLAVQQPLARDKVRQARAMPGAEPLVQQLQAAGVPLAIATSSGRESVEIKLAPHPWLQRIAVRVHGDDPQIQQGKPAPDLFIEAARRLHVEPAQCWAFEDSQAGAKAALAAGCRVFVVPAEGLSRSDYPSAVDWLSSLSETPLDQL
ncbi:HAD family hydrolase [Synechococcus sp. MIT S9452]|uniref:HAD family hydrolase n=1 Tax=Synechococcus sp. MIT S9452 TaxID=3082546 RepID=UPI0039A4DC63